MKSMSCGFLFFFSSRRRHTRWPRDWSSDVCSSDLPPVRFWPTPHGWLLPGGTDVDWLAAGTYDRSVGLSMFTGQVTHRIAADIDTERDHIVATLTEANPGIDVEVLKSFSSGYHHRNGGGDRIETDGDLPIVDLTQVRPDAQLLEALPPTGPPSPTGDRVPLTVGFGVLMMLARVVLGFVSLFALMGTGATAIAFSPLFKGVFAPLPLNPEQVAFVSGAGIVAVLLMVAIVAIFIYRGKSRSEERRVGKECRYRRRTCTAKR